MTLLSKLWPSSTIRGRGMLGVTAVVVVGPLVLYMTVKRFWGPKSVKNNDEILMDPIDPEVEARIMLERRKPSHVWNTVLMFPDYEPESPDSSMNRLVAYLEAAKISIHLCIYLVSHPALQRIISKKWREGLLVSIVTDYDTFTAHNSFGVRIWKNHGIPIRMKNTGTLMHHKFAVIDEEAVITGSLNWTKQGVMCNNENVMITTNARIVQLHLNQFRQLWNKYTDYEAD